MRLAKDRLKAFFEGENFVSGRFPAIIACSEPGSLANGTNSSLFWLSRALLCDILFPWRRCDGGQILESVTLSGSHFVRVRCQVVFQIEQFKRDCAIPRSAASGADLLFYVIFSGRHQ
jgi:hypothetical protein